MKAILARVPYLRKSLLGPREGKEESPVTRRKFSPRDRSALGEGRVGRHRGRRLGPPSPRCGPETRRNPPRETRTDEPQDARHHLCPRRELRLNRALRTSEKGSSTRS